MMPDVPPDLPDHSRIAAELFAQNRFDELAELGTRVSQQDLTLPHLLGAVMADAERGNRRSELLQVVETAQGNSPDDPRLLELRAHLLMHLGQLDDAEACVRQSLRTRPYHRPAQNLLIAVLMQAGRLTDAEGVLAEQLAREPDDSTLNTNMAVILTAQERIEDALRHYRAAILADPTRAQIRLNHSITLLKAGLYAQGWAEHEWRLQLPGHTSLPPDRLLPSITPDLELSGKRIIVTQEEGLGDTLMYLRFIPALAARGAKVMVWGPEGLATLVERVSGVTRYQFGGDEPAYDYHCPFISLPRVFTATDTPFGAPVPYLTVDPARRALWSRRLSADRNFRVGLVWGGAPRPENSDAFMVDQRRSMPLAALAPLAALHGISFYSLQKGPPAAQLADDPIGIIDYTDELTSMDDTAALIDNLDIVVSVDTSVVHLAGGLGARVLLMDRVNPCWRWQMNRTDSPWYPRLTIVRQTRPHDWSDVAERVRDILQKERGR